MLSQHDHGELNPERDSSGDRMELINAGIGGMVGGAMFGVGGRSAQAVGANIRGAGDYVADLYARSTTAIADSSRAAWRGVEGALPGAARRQARQRRCAVSV